MTEAIEMFPEDELPIVSGISQQERDYNAEFAARLPGILRQRELQRWCDGIDAMWIKMAEIGSQRVETAILEPETESWRQHPVDTVQVFYERRCHPDFINDPANITVCVFSPGYGKGWHRVTFYPVWVPVRGEWSRMMRMVNGSEAVLVEEEVAEYAAKLEVENHVTHNAA